MMARVEVAPFFSTASSTDAAAVDMDDVLLRRVAVAHLGDVAQVDDGAVLGEDRQVGQLLEVASGALLSWIVYSKLPIFCGAGRRQQVLRGERVGDVVGRQAARLHRRRIEVDLDLAELAAVRDRGSPRPAP